MKRIQLDLLYRIRKNFTYSEDDFGFNDLDVFNLENNEIITDIKILNNKEKNEKEIIALIKNTIFKFKGSISYKDIFQEYSNKDNRYDKFLKVYKKFGNNDNGKEYDNCKIELIKSYSSNSPEKEELNLAMGWMSSAGYVLQEINKENSFCIFPYVKFNLDGKKDFKSNPNAACQSKLHIFILYSDCLVIFNKLNKNN